MSFTKLTTFAGMVATVAAHGYVSGIVAGGTYYSGWHTSYAYSSPQPKSIGWADTNLDLGPEYPSTYATPDIICAQNATNAALSASIAAGDTIDFQWTTWPSSHHGPVLTYLANCNGDCSTVDKTKLEFFKIDAVGLIDDSSVPGTWASDKLIANNNTWTSTIPADLAAGKYVVRHEIIALHGAEAADGAQNYPQCINLEITGSGSLAPSGTLGEKLYTPTDAGILVNIYAALSYVIPGPAMYNATGAATGSASATASATSVASIASTSAPVTVPTSAVSSSVTPSAISSSAAAVSTTPSTPTTMVTSVASSTSATVTPTESSSPDDDECEA
ncbi:hypothetical protein NHQ30_007759 [Ciborinia camelliae]|nr:hypothetical protein NHQ30_007759 [Ciborinia camelliae]